MRTAGRIVVSARACQRPLAVDVALPAGSRPLVDKLKFMFASYNAGRGNVLRAQRLALADGLDGRRWSSIEARLPAATGHHSRETLGYVNRIFAVKPILK